MRTSEAFLDGLGVARETGRISQDFYDRIMWLVADNRWLRAALVAAAFYFSPDEMEPEDREPWDAAGVGGDDTRPKDT